MIDIDNLQPMEPNSDDGQRNKPVGRPKKNNSDKRSNKIMIYLTDKELEQITRKAQEEQINIAVFVRREAVKASESDK